MRSTPAIHLGLNGIKYSGIYLHSNIRPLFRRRAKPDLLQDQKSSKLRKKKLESTFTENDSQQIWKLAKRFRKLRSKSNRGLTKYLIKCL